jgi:hypothetical protein
MSTVQQRAPFDLSCPANELQVHDLGSDTYGVSGCGKKATYVCVCNKYAGPCSEALCTLDAAQNRDEAPKQ